MATCIDELVKAAKGAISKKEAERIIKSVEKKFKQPFPEKLSKEEKANASMQTSAGTASPEQRMFDAAGEAFKEAVQKQKEQLRRRQLQVDAAARNQYEVATHSRGMVSGVVDGLVGRADGKFHELSLYGRAQGIAELYVAQIQEGLDPYLKTIGHKMTSADELQLITALMDDGPAKAKFFDKTKMTPAEVLARQFRAVENDIYNRKNAAGADIKYLKGHVPQQWDASLVRVFGLSGTDRLRFLNPLSSPLLLKRLRARAMQNWIDFVLPRLDREKFVDDETGLTLDDTKMTEVLQDVWTTLATNGLAGHSEAAMGEASLAQRLGVHRELHFKDPQAFLDANRAFGSQDLFSMLTGSIHRHATEIALLEKYGPNPDAGFKTVLQYAKSSQAEQTLFGREGSTKAEHIFEEIKGSFNSASEEKFDMVSRAMQGIRNYITAAKMGMLLLSQANDVATYRAIAQADGLDTSTSFRLALKMLNPAAEADRAMARRQGMLAQSVINDVAMRYGQDTRGRAFSAKIANWTVELTGAEHWTKGMKQGFQMLIATHINDARGLDHGQLEGRFGEMVKRYGITPAEWDVIRAAEPVTIAGESVITPVAVSKVVTRDIGMGVIENTQESRAKAAEGERLVREASIKYAALLAEEADQAMLTPGPKERAIIKGATMPGTIAGEFMRSVFLFKTFTVAMLTKALPRIYAEGPGKSRAAIMAQFAIGATVAGAFSMQMKEMAKGRNPRDMFTPEFWGAAALQSGGLGIFGDFLFADSNRFGGGPISTMIGPVAGFIDDAHKLTVGNLERAADGKLHVKSGMDDFAGDTIQFAKNYAPMINLWYTRLALDHLLFFHAQEAINPGFLRRMEQRTQKENNQTFWWRPGDSVPQGLPDLSQAFGGR